MGFSRPNTEHPGLEFWVSVGNQMPTPSIAMLGFRGGQAGGGQFIKHICKHSRSTCSRWSHVVLLCTCLLSSHHHLYTLLMKEEHLELQAPDMSIAKVFKCSIILMPRKGRRYCHTQRNLRWFERHWGRLNLCWCYWEAEQETAEGGHSREILNAWQCFYVSALWKGLSIKNRLRKTKTQLFPC